MVFFTVCDESNNLTNLDVHEDTIFSVVMNIVEADFKLSMKEHDIYFNGRVAKETETLKDLNVKDGDLLFVRKKLNMNLLNELSNLNNLLGQNGSGDLAAQYNNNLNESNMFGSTYTNNRNVESQAEILKQEEIERMAERQVDELLSAKNNRHYMEATQRTNAELYDILMRSDRGQLKRYIIEETKKLLNKQKEDQIRFENAIRNPLSEESQKYIAEQIASKHVQTNLELAAEHYPESFADVYMLYIKVEINKISLNAFIDSGAQRSIMSKSYAEKCNIIRLLDTRYRGIAKGVGTQDLLGRIHVVDIKIGNTFFAVSLSIIDNDDIGFIFGLDMLRRHQCSIDLSKNVLVIGSESIPFLSEKDIPENSLRYAA